MKPSDELKDILKKIFWFKGFNNNDIGALTIPSYLESIDSELISFMQDDEPILINSMYVKVKTSFIIEGGKRYYFSRESTWKDWFIL